MNFSLYEATIPSYLQILQSVAGLIDKAEMWCNDHKQAPETLIQARLAPDMLPFAYQISSSSWHSIGAIKGVRNGVFQPDSNPPPETFAGLKETISDALSDLQAVTREEIDGFVGRPARFEYGDYKMHFVAEQFLLSFSQPNFYFHATTAYDILRWKGLPIGKMDYIGKVRKVG